MFAPVDDFTCRWWSGGQCEDFKDTKTSGTKELDLQNIGGVFIVLAVGVCIALVVCLLEVLYKKLKRRKNKVRDVTQNDHDVTNLISKQGVMFLLEKEPEAVEFEERRSRWRRHEDESES